VQQTRTVAIRRTNIGQDKNEPNLLEVINPDKYTILPNTAGCYNAKDAVRTCQLARELLGGHTLVKLEVLGDEKTLYPNIVETLSAAQTLVNDGTSAHSIFGIITTCSVGQNSVLIRVNNL
jgi:thiazole synthase